MLLGIPTGIANHHPGLENLPSMMQYFRNQLVFIECHDSQKTNIHTSTRVACHICSIPRAQELCCCDTSKWAFPYGFIAFHCSFIVCRYSFLFQFFGGDTNIPNTTIRTQLKQDDDKITSFTCFGRKCKKITYPYPQTLLKIAHQNSWYLK
jgi:hypothetical protein